MNRFQSLSASIALISLAFFLISLRPAYAYLDPGTGSYIFQIAIAMLLGATFTVRAFWGRIRAFLQSRFGKKTSHHDE